MFPNFAQRQEFLKLLADFADARDFEIGKCDVFQKIHYFGSEFFEINYFQIFNNNMWAT